MKPKGRASSLALLTVALFSLLVLIRVKEQSSVQVIADKYMSALTLMRAKLNDVSPGMEKQYHPMALNAIFMWVAGDTNTNIRLIRSRRTIVVKNNEGGFDRVSGWVLTNALVDRAGAGSLDIMLVFKELPSTDRGPRLPWDSLVFVANTSEIGLRTSEPLFSIGSKLIFDEVSMNFQDISYSLISMAKSTGIVAESGGEAYYVLKRNWETQAVRLPIINQDFPAFWAALVLPFLVFGLIPIFTSEVRSTSRDLQDASQRVILLRASSRHEGLVLCLWQILIILSPIVICCSSISILWILNASLFSLFLVAVPCVVVSVISEVSLVTAIWRKRSGKLSAA